MNILFLLHSYPKIGGIETVAHTISEYLSKSHQLFFLSRIADSSVDWKDGEYFLFPNKKRKENIDYYNELVRRLSIDIVIHQGPYLPFNRIIFNPDRDPTVRVFSFLHFIPGFDFQRVLDLWRTESRWDKRLAKRLKARLGLFSAQYNPEKIRKKYRLLYEYSEKTITLSKGDIDLFVQSYRLSDCRKLISMPNPSRFSSQGIQVLDRKEKVVLYVGRLDVVQKRVDRLLEIWKSIDSSGWCLKIVGDGPHRRQLEEQVMNEQIPNIQFIGKVNDPEPFYREAQIVVLTSTFEGLPMCILEGLQFGVVPLSFDVSPGVHELIVDNQIGYAVRPFDLSEYSSRLSRLMNDEALRKSFAEKALSVSTNYSLESVGQLWDHLFANEHE